MKPKKLIDYKHQPKSREYLIALTHFPVYCDLLKTNNKPYNKLLDWLITYGKTPENSDRLLPDLKVIATETEIPYSKIATYLKSIYDEIYDLSDTTANLFTENNQKVYSLAFNYLGCYGFFNLGLNDVPRVGERFNFAFIKPKVGSERFWVKTIEHEIINGNQTITIWLNHEHPNQYLNLLKEKAYLNGQLDWNEYYGHLHFDTEKRLVKLYHNL